MRFSCLTELFKMLDDIFTYFKVVSYGGFLRFKTLTENGIPLRSNLRYPIVQLQGNNKIVLEYYLHLPVNDNRYEVRYLAVFNNMRYN